MSRLPMSRWARILAWTGAATIWGTVFVSAKAEPARSDEGPDETTTPTIEESTALAAIPSAPPRGLTILRYTPVAEPLPETRTVYIQEYSPAPRTATNKATKQPSATAKGQPPPPPPAATSQPAPQPVSKGS